MENRDLLVILQIFLYFESSHKNIDNSLIFVEVYGAQNMKQVQIEVQILQDREKTAT